MTLYFYNTLKKKSREKQEEQVLRKNGRKNGKQHGRKNEVLQIRQRRISHMCV